MENDKKWSEIVAEKDARITELEALVKFYEEQFRLLNAGRFGQSSEKGLLPEQIGLFGETAQDKPEPGTEKYHICDANGSENAGMTCRGCRLRSWSTNWMNTGGHAPNATVKCTRWGVTAAGRSKSFRSRFWNTGVRCIHAGTVRKDPHEFTRYSPGTLRTCSHSRSKPP